MRRLLRIVLIAALGLDFDVDIHQRHGGRRHSWNAGGMTQSLRADFPQRLLHFSGKAAHSGVIEPVGNVALLGLFQAIDGFLLLAEIAFGT